MYNNQYMVDNLLRNRDKIDEMLKNYQMPNNQVPMNVFNVGNASQCDFEARMLTKDDNPKEILVQRKTAFICLENALLTIKEVNGDIKEYQIILPKTKEQIENDELKKRIKDLEEQLKERNRNK